MINRMALSLVEQMAGQFPALLILGPRQCGKTTLARGFLKGAYFDLEKPSDYAVFADDLELALNRLEGNLILDEAQELPGLFAVLRSIIDEDRKRAGRFYLLGSVNPSLVRQVSESLAGRVGMVELTPFLYPEVADEVGRLDDYWLRGGYPEACLEGDADRRTRWIEQYVQSLVQRDLAGYGLKTSSQEMRRFLGMLAHVHGGLLNATELGHSLGVTYHTIGGHLDILEGHYLIRRLQPWHTNLGKRLIKTPKLYVRDCGVLHYLLGIRTARDLLQSPRRGASWEGFLVEQVIALERLTHVGSQFWFYRTRAGAEVDLIVDRGKERIGYEFKCASSVARGDASGLRAALDDEIISRGYVVYAGTRRYPLLDRAEALPAGELLGMPWSPE
jgi:uncharacterized protein